MILMMLRTLFIVMSTSFTPQAPALALPSKAEGRFVGGLMGVSAQVRLCVAKKTAVVELSGIPLGGTLSGTAHFQSGEGSPVVVDEPLRSQLRRRFVRIVEARYDEDGDKVFVTVKLPLLLGTQTIMLGRAEEQEESESLVSQCLGFF